VDNLYIIVTKTLAVLKFFSCSFQNLHFPKISISVYASYAIG